MSNQQQQSILILGATGGTGLECIRQLAKHPSKPRIHAFCRSPSKLGNDQDLCQSVIQGDARQVNDLQQALEQTAANVVIVSVGNGESVAKSDIRTASAEALATVLKLPQYKHVRTIVVSSTGAGTSRIIVGMGIGKLISFHLRHVLKDHTGQEAAFYPLRSRTTVVRATALTEDAPTGKLVQFGDTEKSPTIKTDRADLAAWIVQEVCGGTKPIGGRLVNVTGAKQ